MILTGIKKNKNKNISNCEVSANPEWKNTKDIHHPWWPH